jgi:hypothetical protein
MTAIEDVVPLFGKTKSGTKRKKPQPKLELSTNAIQCRRANDCKAVLVAVIGHIPSL